MSDSLDLAILGFVKNNPDCTPGQMVIKYADEETLYHRCQYLADSNFLDVRLGIAGLSGEKFMTIQGITAKGVSRIKELGEKKRIRIDDCHKVTKPIVQDPTAFPASKQFIRSVQEQVYEASGKSGRVCDEAIDLLIKDPSTTDEERKRIQDLFGAPFWPV